MNVFDSDELHMNGILNIETGLITLLFMEIIALKVVIKCRNKNFFNRKIDEWEDTINIENVKELLDKEYIKKLNFGPMILKYCRILINVLDKKNLKIFYHNINTLQTSLYTAKLKDILMGKVQAGVYEAKNNSIQIIEKFKLVLPHELTHLSSTIVKENGAILSGFHQVKGKRAWGHGINEGYTQYFAEKYFKGAFPDMPSVYTLEMEIVQKLMCVIGEKEMANLYFHANLGGLIMQIAKYSSLEEALKFITAVDFTSRFIYNFPKSKEIKIMLELKLKQINFILLKCFFNKQNEELNLGIGKAVLNQEKEEFDSYLGYEITLESLFGKEILNIAIDDDMEKKLKREIKK